MNGPVLEALVVVDTSGFSAHEWATTVRDLWRGQSKGPPGELSDDLASLRRFFDPTARGSRLRDSLDTVPPVSEDLDAAARLLPRGAAVELGGQRWLVTPAGRALLALVASDGSAEARLRILQQLASLYSELCQRPLVDAARLMRGEGPPLHPASCGLLLFLAVNRHTSPERALPTPKPRSTMSDPLAAIVNSVVRSFMSAFADGDDRDQRESVLGWPLTELKRRLGASIALTNESIYLRDESIEKSVAFVGFDLFRRSKSPWEAVSAFEALVEELHRTRGELAAYGAVHERPSETRRVRQGLSAAVSYGRPQ